MGNNGDVTIFHYIPYHGMRYVLLLSVRMNMQCMRNVVS